jgi:hypothetical protein
MTRGKRRRANSDIERDESGGEEKQGLYDGPGMQGIPCGMGKNRVEDDGDGALEYGVRLRAGFGDTFFSRAEPCIGP